MSHSLHSTAYPFWLADAPLSDPKSLSTPAPNVTSDPLIDQGGQLTIRVGAVLLIFAVAAVIVVIGRRV